MSTIRYTAGGDYDPGNSAGATTSSDIDFSDQSFRTVGRVDGPDEFYLASSSDGALLRTADGGSLLRPSTDGIAVDFSDKIGLVSLTGGDLGDSLRSGANNDTLEGGGGNDVLEAGLGINIIDGGSGIDTISYEHLSLRLNAGVAVYLNNGYAHDLVDTSRLSDSFSNIQNVIGSGREDLLHGSSGNNVFEGGAGADTIRGNGGIDTASYGGSTEAVNVDLTTNVNTGGDAQGDDLAGIANILGSTFADILTGDGLANTLTGNGGGDALYGMGGADRLVITDTPTMIDGGAGIDFLFVTGGGSVSLAEATFTGIEAVYVRNATALDMSAVTNGTRIVSQSASGQGVDFGVDIVGTSGADRIVAGKGGDTIEGGAGGDKIFAGGGADTFRFQAGFGRDNLYGLDLALDHIAIDMAGVESGSMKLTELQGGQDTLVTFAGIASTDKIILYDVTVDEIRAVQSALFTFGA